MSTQLQETHTSISQSVTEVESSGGGAHYTTRSAEVEVETLVAHTTQMATEGEEDVEEEEVPPRDITREDIEEAAYSALTEQAELIKQLLAENRCA